jgi:hypothetical protein
MTDDFSHLPETSDEQLRETLVRASADATILLALRDAIADLDVVRDAGRVVELRNKLAVLARSERESGEDAAALLGVTRALLDRTARRLSPSAVELSAYLAATPADLTPAVIRSLALLSSRSRPLDELESLLECQGAGLARVVVVLLQLGVLLQNGPSSRTRSEGGDDALYELTPIGKAALPSMAERVLDLELGRFPWPTDLTRPADWARVQEGGGQFFGFNRDGHDGDVAAACIERDVAEVGLLSAPHLKGVARLDKGVRFSTVALLPSQMLAPAAASTDGPEIVKTRVDRIVDDHRKVRDRVPDTSDKWSLEFFAEPDMRERAEPLVETACDEAEVEYAFAA